MATTASNPAAGNGYDVVNLAWTFPAQENFGSAGIQNFQNVQVVENGVILYGGAVRNGDVNDTVGFNTAYNWTVTANYALTGNPSGSRTDSGSGRTGPATPPSPGYLSASGGSSPGSISVSWGSSSGASGYILSRDGSQIYSGSATSYTDSGLTQGSTHKYAVQAYTSNATATVYSGSATGSGVASSAPPSNAVYGYDGGGGSAVVSWDFSSYPGYGLSSITFTNYVTYNKSPASTSDSNSISIGYSSSVNWTATDNHGAGYSGTIFTGPAPTPPAPPAAPNAATNLVVTPNGSGGYSLTWTAAVGGASGYRIQRQYGATTDNPLTTSGTSIADSSPPNTRPLVYSVYAYNTGAGGTTYAGPSNAVTLVALVVDSVGMLIG